MQRLGGIYVEQRSRTASAFPIAPRPLRDSPMRHVRSPEIGVNNMAFDNAGPSYAGTSRGRDIDSGQGSRNSTGKFPPSQHDHISHVYGDEPGSLRDLDAHHEKAGARPTTTWHNTSGDRQSANDKGGDAEISFKQQLPFEPSTSSSLWHGPLQARAGSKNGVFKSATVAEPIERQLPASGIFEVAADRSTAPYPTVTATGPRYYEASPIGNGDRYGYLRRPAVRATHLDDVFVHAAQDGSRTSRSQRLEEHFRTVNSSSAPALHPSTDTVESDQHEKLVPTIINRHRNISDVHTQRSLQDQERPFDVRHIQHVNREMGRYPNLGPAETDGNTCKQTCSNWLDQDGSRFYRDRSSSVTSATHAVTGLEDSDQNRQQLQQNGRSESTRHGEMIFSDGGGYCEHGDFAASIANGRRSPDYGPRPPNGRPQSMPRASASTATISSTADRLTRSQSPRGVLMNGRLGQRPLRITAPASFVHSRSLSEGHHKEGGWVSPVAVSVEGAPLVAARCTTQRTQAPHSRTHSDGSFSSGRWQDAYDPGGGGGGDHASAAHANSPDHARHGAPNYSSHAAGPTTVRRGFNVTRHPAVRYPHVRHAERSSSNSFSDDAICSGRDTPSPNMAAATNEQQRRMRPAMPGSPPGFSRNGTCSRSSPELRSSTLAGSSETVLTTVKSLPLSASICRTMSPEVSMDAGIRMTTAPVLQRGGGSISGSGGSPSTVQQSSTPIPPPPILVKPPAPRNPLEWLQGLHRARKCTTTIKKDLVSGFTTPPTSCESSVSSLVPSPARGALAAGGSIKVDGRGCLHSITAAVAAGSVAAQAFSRVFAGTCPAPDCPGTPNCLPEATPDMIVYEVKFKRATRTFLPAIFFSGSDEGESCASICCGDRVKVEADRGEDLGTIHRLLPLSEYLQAVFEEKQAKAAKIAENGGGGSGNGESGKKKRNKSKKSEEDGGRDGASKASKQQQQQKEEEVQEETCPVRAIKRIIRTATAKELEQLDEKFQEEAQILRVCQTKVRNRSLPMKIVDAEYQFDRHKLTLFFEAERRIDFRELVRDLFAVYKTRIWMQQVKDKDAQASPSSVSGSSSSDKSEASVPTLTSPEAGSSSAGSATGSVGAVVPSPHHDADHDSGYGSNTSTNSDTTSSAGAGNSEHAFSPEGRLFAPGNIVSDSNAVAKDANLFGSDTLTDESWLGAERSSELALFGRAADRDSRISSVSAAEKSGDLGNDGGGSTRSSVVHWLANTVGENNGGVGGDESISPSPFSLPPMIDFS